jgi:ABC-type cobalamin transport system ATPase subunit
MSVQQQITAINAAIASGERVVQYNGKRIEYRSIDELVRARQILTDQLVGTSQMDVLNRATVASFTRD